MSSSGCGANSVFPRVEGDRQRGFATVAWMAAIGLAVVMIAFVAQVVAVQYGLAAVRRAADEGARAGSALGAGIEVCEHRAEQVLRGPRGVLSGELGRSITVQCWVDEASDPPHVVAIGRGELGLEFPLLGSTYVEVSGSAVIEQEP